jgi:putative oxidoreductase
MRNLNNYFEGIAKPFVPLTPWILRLVIGISFILHGLYKFPLPYLINDSEILGGIVAIAEVLAGAGVMIGGIFRNELGNIITRLSGGAILVIMIGALIIAHPNWFQSWEGLKKFIWKEQIYLLVLGFYFAVRGNN